MSASSQSLNQPKSEHLCSSVSPSPRGGSRIPNHHFDWLFGAESSDVKLKQRLGDRLTRSNQGSSSEAGASARWKRFTVGLYSRLQELHSLNRIKHLYFRNVWRISVNPFNTLLALLSRDGACDARRSRGGFLG